MSLFIWSLTNVFFAELFNFVSDSFYFLGIFFFVREYFMFLWMYYLSLFISSSQINFNIFTLSLLINHILLMIYILIYQHLLKYINIHSLFSFFMNITCIFFFLIIIHIFLTSHFLKIIYTLRVICFSLLMRAWYWHYPFLNNFFSMESVLYNTQKYLTKYIISVHIHLSLFTCAEYEPFFFPQVHSSSSSIPSLCGSHTGEEKRRREEESHG